MPMIATTIISSIRVKPFCSVLIWRSPYVNDASIGLLPDLPVTCNLHATRGMRHTSHGTLKMSHLSRPCCPFVSGTVNFGHSRCPLSGACRWARGRCDGHVGEEFLRDHLHKRRRISGFLQRPLDAVAEARLLVEIRPVFGSESADARKYSIERLHRLFHRLFARQVRARLREALQKLGDDRVGEFVDVLPREPIQQHACPAYVAAGLYADRLGERLRLKSARVRMAAK